MKCLMSLTSRGMAGGVCWDWRSGGRDLWFVYASVKGEIRGSGG